MTISFLIIKIKTENDHPHDEATYRGRRDPKLKQEKKAEAKAKLTDNDYLMSSLF